MKKDKVHTAEETVHPTSLSMFRYSRFEIGNSLFENGDWRLEIADWRLKFERTLEIETDIGDWEFFIGE